MPRLILYDNSTATGHQILATIEGDAKDLSGNFRSLLRLGLRSIAIKKFQRVINYFKPIQLILIDSIEKI